MRSRRGSGSRTENRRNSAVGVWLELSKLYFLPRISVTFVPFLSQAAFRSAIWVQICVAVHGPRPTFDAINLPIKFRPDNFGLNTLRDLVNSWLFSCCIPCFIADSDRSLSGGIVKDLILFLIVRVSRNQIEAGKLRRACVIPRHFLFFVNLTIHCKEVMLSWTENSFTVYKTWLFLSKLLLITFSLKEFIVVRMCTSELLLSLGTHQ